MLAPYAAQDAAAWDRLVARAPGGTVMQSRRFLDYHGDRFRDLSLVLRKGEGLAAVFPLAAHPLQADLAVSHPGSSFGGVIALSRDPAEARRFLRLAAGHLIDQGFARLSYRMAPSAVLRLPDDGLLPDLLRLGRLTQLDLCSVLPLQMAGKDRLYWQSEIRRAERKGLRATPVETPAEWAELHGLLSARLEEKYGKRPVHSVAELIDLHARLGPQSRAQLIRDGQGQALAGQWFIDYGTGTLHNQCNGATDAGLALGAASYGIALALERARAEGFRTFSFGRSTNDDGWTENRALLRFKAGFGAGLSAQYAFDLPLDALTRLRD
jgi:hypothetical protein